MRFGRRNEVTTGRRPENRPKAIRANPSGRAVPRNNTALLPLAKLHLEHDADTDIAFPLFLEQLPRPGQTCVWRIPILPHDFV